MKVESGAVILVEKRTYKPAGWKDLREVVVRCRLTPKRAYVESGTYKGHVFNRENGAEILTQECRINQSYRYSILAWTV